jgi:hypothetical protein
MGTAALREAITVRSQAFYPFTNAGGLQISAGLLIYLG